MNHNALHFLCTIWNLWALIYVQSHFHHIWIIDGVIKFLSHVSHVTPLIVSTQRTSLQCFMLIGLLFPEICGIGVTRTNQTSKMELFCENKKQLKSVNNFRKRFYLRCSIGYSYATVVGHFCHIAFPRSQPCSRPPLPTPAHHPA